MKSTRRTHLGALSGASIHLRSGAPSPSLALIKRAPPDLSPEAKKRLKWFDHYRTHGENASLTCRYFGISRQTFYRWKRRYRPHHLASLEAHPSRPKRTRPRTWTSAQVEAVLALRIRYPRWGKDKLAVLLAREGLVLSVSKVGRILVSLRARGALREPPLHRISAKKRLARRPHAIRKPQDYPVDRPGALVQLDTVDVRPLPGVILKQFTALDVVSRWSVVDLHERATAKTATGALEALLTRMPFAVQAVQIDGGSEFMAEFETACADRGLQLFVLPPRSPKLNGAVERANRTHTEEFYECTPMRRSISQLAPLLAHWETVYNTIRPHQALHYQTPREFLDRWSLLNPLRSLDPSPRKEEVSPR